MRPFRFGLLVERFTDPAYVIAGAGRGVLSIAAQHADTIALLSWPLSSGVLADSAAARSAEHVAEQIEIVSPQPGLSFPAH